MSIALFGLAEPAIAQIEAKTGKIKTPPKRQSVARPDAAVVPEPR